MNALDSLRDILERTQPPASVEVRLLAITWRIWMLEGDPEAPDYVAWSKRLFEEAWAYTGVRPDGQGHVIVSLNVAKNVHVDIRWDLLEPALTDAELASMADRVKARANSLGGA